MAVTTQEPNEVFSRAGSPKATPPPPRKQSRTLPENPPRPWLARFRPPRRLKFTREGKYFLGLTLGVGFAAINTANNLLYLLLGMLLALIVVSGAMSEIALRHLTVERRLPPRAQAGRAYFVEIEVRNRKKRIPSFAIEVEDLRAGQPADKRCFFLKIAAESTQVAGYRRVPQRRGKDHHIGFRIATRFPFGLFEKSREVRVPGELVIYPAVDPVRLPFRQGGRLQGDASLLAAGFGEEMIGLRPMREGDDPRDIYWRKSILGPVLRERAREGRPEIRLVLDVKRPQGGDPAWDADFERRIRDIASQAVAHIKRGDSVTLATTTGDLVRADKGVGADPLLRFLALVEPIEASDAIAPRADRRAS